MHELDRDRSPGAQVHSLVDFTHAAAAQQATDLVGVGKDAAGVLPRCLCVLGRQRGAQVAASLRMLSASLHCFWAI